VADVTLELLADRPDLIEPVGLLRWNDWGKPSQPDEPAWWIAATAHESGRAGLPVTYAAVSGDNILLGAAGIGEFDVPERRDRSPWVLGLVVRPSCRTTGIGRRLLRQLEYHAADLAYQNLWVANDGTAVEFYTRCGYAETETLAIATGATDHIMTRSPMTSGA
jgi:GNAT superfamily N-acetyltransferase